jgi:hypothetical protein
LCGDEIRIIRYRGQDRDNLVGVGRCGDWDRDQLVGVHSWAPMVKKTSIGSIPIID